MSLRNRVAGWFVTAIVLAAGCHRASEPTSTPRPAPPQSADTDVGHDHDSHGPHGGELLELGAEEYHAELVHDEKQQTVTIYILNGSATSGVPIEAREVTINLVNKGQAAQFALPAVPDAGDPPGTSSRFQSRDVQLHEQLETASPAPQLVVDIAGKQYRGAIEHAEHGHDD